MPALRRNMSWQLLLHLTYASALATNYTDTTHRLKEQLLHGYNKDVLPLENATAPASVRCMLLFSSILTFDELSMELVTSGYISITWKEPRIQWRPSEDNGFTAALHIPVSKVWSPGLALVNPTESIESMTRDWMNVRYMPDGTGMMYVGSVFKTLCSVDITYYPFDKQECSLNFMTVNYQSNEVELVALTDKLVLSGFVDNGVWMIDDTKSVALVHQSGVYLYQNTLYLRRRPTFFVVNILLPVVFMALLNIFVFALPPESGERMSYCITVLLAIAVFLTLLGDNIPKTSSPMSFLSYFMLVQFSWSVFICIATIYNLRIFHTGENKDISQWLETLTRKVNLMLSPKRSKKGICHVQERTSNRVSAEIRDKGNDNTNGTVTMKANSKHAVRALGNSDHKVDSVTSSNKSCWTHDLDTNFTVQRSEFGSDQKHINEKQKEEKREEEEEEGHVTWQDVSRMVDKVLALTSFLIIVFSTIVFIAIVLRNT